VDASGRRRHVEFLAPNRLGDAVARLYERYAELLPENAGRARAEATARSVAAILGPFDLERYAGAIDSEVEFVDHRRMGFPSGRGAAELLRSVGSLLETGENVTTHVDDVLGLRADALLVRWTTSGRDRSDGGPFEWQFLRLCVFGEDGLLARAEQFDVDCAADALARFDQLAGEGSAHPVSAARSAEVYDRDRIVEAPARDDELAAGWAREAFANAAARAVVRMERAWEAGDWDGLVASFAQTFGMDDRRALVGLQLSGDDFLANLRMMFDLPASRWRNQLRATRGARLALFHCRFTGGAGESLVEFEHLSLVEVDGSERYARLVIFDPDDVDAAHAELDERSAAGDAPSRRRASMTRDFRQAFAARDWTALAALLAPNLVVTDHRLLGWETLHGPAGYIRALQSLVELAPDVQLHVDHLTMSGARFLYVTTWRGTREGGAFESPSAIVCELDEMGRIRVFDQYDLSQMDEARDHLDTGRAPSGGGSGPAD
jgi:hypothetical protein